MLFHIIIAQEVRDMYQLIRSKHGDKNLSLIHIFGDNPNNSEDSRSANIGPVDEDDIVGKAWFHLKSSTEGMGFIK